MNPLQPGHPALRARIADALGQVLAETSHRALGAELGHSGSTIDRRGGALDAWPSSDLLALATSRPVLGAAVRHYLDGDLPAADALRTETTVRRAVTELCEDAARLSQRMEDGRIDAREAEATIGDLDHLMATIAALRGDLVLRARA